MVGCDGGAVVGREEGGVGEGVVAVPRQGCGAHA